MTRPAQHSAILIHKPQKHLMCMCLVWYGFSSSAACGNSLASPKVRIWVNDEVMAVGEGAEGDLEVT